MLPEPLFSGPTVFGLIFPSFVLAVLMIFYSILAGSRMLLGKKVMSWQVLLPRKIQKEIGAGTVSTVPYLKLS